MMKAYFNIVQLRCHFVALLCWFKKVFHNLKLLLS